MSSAIWPFTFQRRGFRERLSYRNAGHEQGAGRMVVQKLHAAGTLLVDGELLFPNDSGSTWAALQAFWENRYGSYDTFLYKAQDAGNATIADSFTAVAAQTDFDCTRRYVDTSTVVVKKNGVTQTLTTHYTLENESGGAYVLGTSTKLVVAFGSAPGAGVTVTIDGEFYYPVRFAEDDMLSDQEGHARGVGPTSVANRQVRISMREAGPGYSYAATPNVL